MFELEKLGIPFGKKSPLKDLFKHRDKFELVDGIQFGQTRTVTGPDDAPLFKVSLQALPILDGWAADKIFRVVVTYNADGGVKELLIDFSEPYLEWQADENPDPWQREL
jgi:hypothetical protein